MFRGSLVAMVTPMLIDGTVDIDSLRQLVEWHIENHTDALVILGTTGESVTLTPGEHQLVIKNVIDQAKTRIPVIAGTGTNSTDFSIHLTKQAMELGVDACLLVTPYYNKPTQEGLYLHYKTIAQSCPIPLILYNIPSRTACDLKPETVEKLAGLPNIIGLKEGTGDISRAKDILSRVDGQIDLYSGDDCTCLDFIFAGGKGVISVTANVAPKKMHEMCTFALAGNIEEASALNQSLSELHQKMFIETNPIPVKWVLHEMGIIPAGIRLPLTPLSANCHEPVRVAMKLAGIAV